MTKTWENNSKEYKDEVARIEALAVNDEVFKKLDELQAKLTKNESYSYLPDYQATKDSIQLEIKTIREGLQNGTS